MFWLSSKPKVKRFEFALLSIHRTLPAIENQSVKNIALILFCLAIASCRQSEPSNSEPQEKQEYENEVVYDALFKNVILGDFNGNGKEDELKETLISEVNNESIDALPQLEYDSLAALVNNKKPVLSLRSSNGDIPELLISKNPSFGLLWIKNEGDLDNDGSDEISVIVDWADWSQVNSCTVYSLKKDEWLEYAKFDVREWQISKKTDFNGFIVKNKKGIYEVSTFDSEMNEVLKPLKEVLVTSTKSHGLNNHNREARVS